MKLTRTTPPTLPTPLGFFTAVSPPNDGGVNFSTPALVGPTTTPIGQPDVLGGDQSRVIAAGTTFQAFVPRLTPDPENLPNAIHRFESSDGINWTDMGRILPAPGDFAPPNNNSNPFTERACTPGTADANCGPVWYAPLLDAQGDSSGRWAVVFQAKNPLQNSRNNVMICVSDRNPSCAFINPGAADEFMASVAISGDGSYWVSYLAFTPVGSNPASNVFSQTIRLPPGGYGPGGTTTSGTTPVVWWASNRCPSAGACYAMGDYARMAADSSGNVSVPLIQQAPFLRNDLFGIFLEAFQQGAQGAVYAPYSAEPKDADRAATSVVLADPSPLPFQPWFIPRFTPIFPGMDIKTGATPVPPWAFALAPGRRNDHWRLVLGR